MKYLTMINLFLWPALVIIFASRKWQINGLGLEILVIGIIRFFLLASLIVYCPLAILYWRRQQSFNRHVNILAGFGLGIASFFAAISIVGFIDRLGFW